MVSWIKRHAEFLYTSIRHRFEKVRRLFDIIDNLVLSAVTVSGLLLQSLNVLVFLSKHLRSKTYRFVVSMSLMDVLFLLVQLPFLSVPFFKHEGANASPTAAAYFEFV